MDYVLINQTLEKVFGRERVELWQWERGQWKYKIVFFCEPNPVEIEMAKAIVNAVEPSEWADDKNIFQSNPDLGQAPPAE